MKLTAIFTSLFILVACSSLRYGQNSRISGKCPSEYGTYRLFPFERESKAFVVFHKLTNLAPDVRDQVEAQIKKRVGSKAYKRLKLEEGIARDFDESIQLNPKDKTRVDGYDLTFKFIDDKRGLRGYIFSVAANQDGIFLSNVDFPNSGSDPGKIELIACSRALEIAEQNGFPKSRSSIYIGYDKESESLAWEVHDNKAVEPDSSANPLLALVQIGQGTFRHILINANSGKVIKIYKETIIL